MPGLEAHFVEVCDLGANDCANDCLKYTKVSFGVKKRKIIFQFENQL